MSVLPAIKLTGSGFGTMLLRLLGEPHLLRESLTFPRLLTGCTDSRSGLGWVLGEAVNDLPSVYANQI